MEAETFAGLRLRAVLRLLHVDGENDEGFVVRYEQLESLPQGSGVYVVKKDDVVAYCGKFDGNFSKRWLYKRGQYIYHAKRHVLARALENGHKVMVFSETLPELHKQQPTVGSRSIDFERAIYDHYHPEWNRTRP